MYFLAGDFQSPTNSWGTSWGESGYGWVDYDLLSTVSPTAGPFATEMYVLHDSTSHAAPVPTPAPSAQHDVTPIQTDRYYGRVGDKPYWEWTLALQGSLTELAAVTSVTYHLGPGFPIPDALVSGTPQNGFGMKTTGWEPRRIGMTIRYQDGATREKSILLRFRSAATDTLSLQNTARQFGQDANGGPRYFWTAYIAGPAGVVRQISSVRYFLHPTFQPNVYDVNQGPEYGFPFSATGWGEFTLQATVTFTNGATQTLSHKLELLGAR